MLVLQLETNFFRSRLPSFAHSQWQQADQGACDFAPPSSPGTKSLFQVLDKVTEPAPEVDPSFFGVGSRLWGWDFTSAWAFGECTERERERKEGGGYYSQRSQPLFTKGSLSPADKSAESSVCTPALPALLLHFYFQGPLSTPYKKLPCSWLWWDLASTAPFLKLTYTYDN